MKAILGPLILSSCATLQTLFEPVTSEYCGDVGTLKVYRQEFSFATCKEVLEVTKAAYGILQRQRGLLQGVWRVEYMSGMIAVDAPFAVTNPEQHLIRVQEQEPRSILHELGHAFLYENHTGGRSQHRVMCADKRWQQLEHNFDVRPYCHLVGLE